MLAYFRNGPGPWWSEALILALFIIGALASLWRHRADSAWAQHVAHPGLARFLTFYTLLLVLVYSLLPYKTPWLLLNFLQSGILVAGIGALVCVRAMPGTSTQNRDVSVAAGSNHSTDEPSAIGQQPALRCRSAQSLCVCAFQH
jgi:hypothetical protein